MTPTPITMNTTTPSSLTSTTTPSNLNLLSLISGNSGVNGEIHHENNKDLNMNHIINLNQNCNTVDPISNITIEEANEYLLSLLENQMTF